MVTKAENWYFCEITVRIYVVTTIEKFFLDSDDGLCIKKIRQIQWDETFLIWTMAFWEKWGFLIMKVFCFPSYWSGLISMKGSEIRVLNPCDDSYFCQLLCQLSQLFNKVVKRVNKENNFCNFLKFKMHFLYEFMLKNTM